MFDSCRNRIPLRLRFLEIQISVDDTSFTLTYGEDDFSLFYYWKSPKTDHENVRNCSIRQSLALSLLRHVSQPGARLSVDHGKVPFCLCCVRMCACVRICWVVARTKQLARPIFRNCGATEHPECPRAVVNGAGSVRRSYGVGVRSSQAQVNS